MKFPRIPNPWRDLREARAMLAEVLRERDGLFEQMQALRSTLAEEQAEIRALRSDREKDLDTLNALAEERSSLIDQVQALANQFYNWAGPPMEEPIADEGAQIIPIFSAKLKRERLN